MARALTAIVNGQTYTYLLTVMPPSGSRELYETWPLERSGDEVRMRNVLGRPRCLDAAVLAFLREHGV
jgi:hypothetical protein